MTDLSLSYQHVLRRIAAAERAAGRNPGEVQLIAVSKRQSIDAIRALAGLGQRHFGESYLQEAVEKIDRLAKLDLIWHFIGPIQSNKTRQIANHFAWVHSIDRFKIASRLNEQRRDDLPPLQVCLQVNVSGESQKSGVGPEALSELAQAVIELPRLHLAGLMTIPRRELDTAKQSQAFERLANALSELNQVLDLRLDCLSMGMSRDLEAAVSSGATQVRVGSDIFGPRR